MPDARQHRGPHPEDQRLFGPSALERLGPAAADLAWLLGRGYAAESAVTFIGNRFQLDARQRTALLRSVCAPAVAEARRARRVEVAGQDLLVDGFNVVVTVEAALSGAVLLRGSDGLLRDLSSVHGSYRAVAETERAVDLLLRATSGAAQVLWLFDRPVSNSGRLAELLRSRGAAAELEDRVDSRLRAHRGAVATGDGPVVSAALASVDLVGAVVAGLPEAWVVPLGPQRVVEAG